MPIIQIQILEGRTDENIKNLIANVTETTVNTLDVNPEQVRVIVNTVPRKYWGVGGTTKDTHDQ